MISHDLGTRRHEWRGGSLSRFYGIRESNERTCRGRELVRGTITFRRPEIARLFHSTCDHYFFDTEGWVDAPDVQV